MYDVVVVGGGIGGLTVAALLSARGIKTCLCERQSQVGGCIGRVEFSGYEFEPGMGLYTSFGSDEIYDQIFAKLPVECPQATLIQSNYLVRFDRDIVLNRSDDDFYEQLRLAFPECTQEAIEFYRLVNRVHEASSSRSGLFSKTLNRLRFSGPGTVDAARIQTALSYASATSARFQRFIDAQLQAFLHTSIDRCAFLEAATALSLPRSNLYSIKGGVATIAEALAESIKLSGGAVRLNTPVLRLAYNEKGTAVGVDLLTGERVLAKHAIISNLTIWDTYGKLVGLNRTPASIKNELAKTESRGAYVVYAALEESALLRLPARNLLAALEPQDEEENAVNEITIAVGQRSVDGRWPVTIKTSTDVTPWFSFHTSEDDFERQDQQILEHVWSRLHSAIPELGAGIEVIETANPQTYYEQTRRKLGMVMGVERKVREATHQISNETCIPNLFVVGDTVSPFGISGVAESAARLANNLAK